MGGERYRIVVEIGWKRMNKQGMPYASVLRDEGLRILEDTDDYSECS